MEIDRLPASACLAKFSDVTTAVPLWSKFAMLISIFPALQILFVGLPLSAQTSFAATQE
jgi:hypothetical protein